MSCPICDKKPMNCDCTPMEREIYRRHAALANLEMQDPPAIVLTDAEREAIDFAWCSVGRDDAFNQQHAERIRETLEQLLERTK